MIPFCIDPTAAIDEGQMSRISRTIFFNLILAKIIPAQPQKNCGDVATTTSGFFTKIPRMVDAIAKLM